MAKAILERPARTWRPFGAPVILSPPPARRRAVVAAAGHAVAQLLSVDPKRRLDDDLVL